MSAIHIMLLCAAPPLCAGAFLLLRARLHRLADRRIARYQNDLVARHCEEVQNIYRQMRGWRHDYHNHIQTLQALRAQGQDARLDAYLTTLNADLSAVDTLIKSGHVMVDAILNSKLSLAKAQGIAIHATAMVPAALAIPEVDLCVIVGNLLDNAIEANLRCARADDRFLRVYMDVKGDQLYLSITNASGGVPQKVGGRYLSTKGVQRHGFGLQRVDRLIDKHEGYLKCRDEEGVFTAEALLPL